MLLSKENGEPIKLRTSRTDVFVRIENDCQQNASDIFLGGRRPPQKFVFHYKVSFDGSIQFYGYRWWKWPHVVPPSSRLQLELILSLSDDRAAPKEFLWTSSVRLHFTLYRNPPAGWTEPFKTLTGIGLFSNSRRDSTKIYQQRLISRVGTFQWKSGLSVPHIHPKYIYMCVVRCVVAILVSSAQHNKRACPAGKCTELLHIIPTKLCDNICWCQDATCTYIVKVRTRRRRKRNGGCRTWLIVKTIVMITRSCLGSQGVRHHFASQN